MSDLQEAQAFFAGDRYATAATGCEIVAVGDHYARCKLALDDRHYNAVGQVMGGVAYTLADFTFAVATNFRQPPTVTVSATISYPGRVKGNTLFSETRLIKDGHRNCFYEVTITDDQDTLIAVINFTGAHV